MAPTCCPETSDITTTRCAITQKGAVLSSAVFISKSAIGTWQRTTGFIPQLTNHSADASVLCTARVDVAAE
jgi:hypothetical protein